MTTTATPLVTAPTMTAPKPATNGTTPARKPRQKRENVISFQVTEPDVLERLEKLAKAEHRDLNNYASYILHKHIRDHATTAGTQN